MSKRQANAKLDAALNADIEEYREQEGIETRSDAVRNLLRRGVRDYNQPGPALRFLRTAAQLTLIAAMMAVVIAGAFRFPARMLWVGGTFGLLSLFCGCAYGIGVTSLSWRDLVPSRRDRRAVADGGEEQ
jgi:hypothetical protein